MNIKRQTLFNSPMGKQKKAALELSVTAIVVLILAIVMLGLGLGFVRGMFGKVATSFEEQIASEPEPPQASGAEPITLSRETIVAHPKDAEVLKISFYNPSSQASSVTPAVTCNTASLVTAPQVNPKTIAQGESGEFNYLFTVSSTATVATDLCKVSITVGAGASAVTYEKDFVIKVTK